MQKQTINRKAFIILAINSLIYFMLAYYVVILLTNGFSIFLAKTIGLDSVLYHYGFFMDSSSHRWSNEDIILVYLLGNGLTLVLGLIFGRLNMKMVSSNGLSKLFFLWGFMLSFIWFFGNIIVGAFVNFGIGAAMRAMSLPLLAMIIMAILAIAMLIVTGKFTARFTMLTLASFFPRILGYERIKGFYALILIPMIAGNLLVFLLKIPHQTAFHYQETLILISGFIILAGAVYEYREMPNFSFKNNPQPVRLQYIAAALTILTISAVRIGLANGVSL
ncbi:MAG: hypothetical protein K9I94_11405 [Bacteroidales bacterium]|nr:hypothetical protein [Bacteroidales bacterium]